MSLLKCNSYGDEPENKTRSPNVYAGCNVLWLFIQIIRTGYNILYDRGAPISSKLSEILSSMERNGKKPFPFESSFVTHKFKKYLRASGVKNSEGLNLHSLRHTFASHLVMAGVNLCTVSKLLGHSSVRVTEMYAHLVPDHLKVSVERLQY